MIFLSGSEYDQKCCLGFFSEAEYAFQLRKKIIPLKMEGNYKADGWLGLIIGTELSYDFSEIFLFENKAKDILWAVHSTLVGRVIDDPSKLVVDEVKVY